MGIKMSEFWYHHPLKNGEVWTKNVRKERVEMESANLDLEENKEIASKFERAGDAANLLI